MNPQLLVKKGEDTPVAQFCTACGTVYALGDSPNGDARAEECCKPYKCRTCGADVERYRTECDRCFRERKDADEAARFAAAARVPLSEASELLYDPAGDRYADAEAMQDDLPALGYAYACFPVRLTLNAAELVDDALEAGEHHEDAYVPHDLIQELQAYLDEWAGRANVESWFPDHSRVVVFAEATTAPA